MGDRDDTRPLRRRHLLRARRGTAPKHPALVALDCLVALVALQLAFIALVGFPGWLAAAFVLLAGTAVFFATRELYLWWQHLRMSR
ncbi:hypothetical protein [Kineococcus sp. SYSU DK018]|uniref:hypothetical protein n=1 Tax=Kineococcus sp. SYSU DK018 TaxID=3383139 RepID=UPI003D7D986B